MFVFLIFLGMVASLRARKKSESSINFAVLRLGCVLLNKCLFVGKYGCW